MLEAATIHVQYADTFAFDADPDAIAVIDQHRLHEIPGQRRRVAGHVAKNAIADAVVASEAVARGDP
ncbi:hypothetical protein N789_09220 [Arenimonas oryziterrae DSM 21050 = YC6267]|uniref:Uncharacterized protein n=1 Tax=Arenimonas oryziterrae DSM 21050 = YC6267 TaxID=1121015 RepID=A0A091BGI8_9GAMM|nr:hypothetical protein N789_09220 [Arenimonas oryziterrae DSM 21050 = YC6267]